MIRFNINKYFGCFTIMLTLFLVSCKNDPVVVAREDAEINLLLNNVLSPFTTYSDDNMKMYVKDGIPSKIIVKAFIYDDSGHLTNTLSKEIADYNTGSVSFTTNLSGSNPQIVCLTYASYTDSEGERYDAYKISGENLQSTLKIERYLGYSLTNLPWLVLGGAVKSVGIASGKIDIEVKPLGGLAYLDWQNIHAHDGQAKSPQRYKFMQKFNDVAMIKDGQFTYSSTLSSIYYFYADVFPSLNPSYNAIYEMRFMFPSTVETYGCGGYSPSNYSSGPDADEVITGQSENKTIQVEAGKQYIFRMNCQDYSISVNEGILDD